MTANNGRIASIDIVKVFAVLLVLNSHMGVCFFTDQITGGDAHLSYLQPSPR